MIEKSPMVIQINDQSVTGTWPCSTSFTSLDKGDVLFFNYLAQVILAIQSFIILFIKDSLTKVAQQQTMELIYWYYCLWALICMLENMNNFSSWIIEGKCIYGGHNIIINK